MAFNGKPLIHYTIEAAVGSGLFETVLVTTDDPEIKSCCEDTGCKIIQRSPELATDNARVVEVLNDLLTKDEYQGRFDYFCCLYATSPLRTSEDINGSFDLMIRESADFCQSVTDFETSPFFAYDMDGNSQIQRRWPDIAILPPWRKPHVVVDNGSIYWARVKAFFETGELDGPKTVGYSMPRKRSVDIDTMTDFNLALFYLNESTGQ